MAKIKEGAQLKKKPYPIRRLRIRRGDSLFVALYQWSEAGHLPGGRLAEWLEMEQVENEDEET